MTFDPDSPVRVPVARDTDALAEPVAAAVLACPSVAGLSGGPFGTVGTEDAADITALRRRIDTEAVPRLRRALDLTTLSADLLIRLDDARSARLR